MKKSLQRLHLDFLEELEIGAGRSHKTVENYDHYLQRFYEVQKIETLGDISLDAVRTFRRYLSEQFEVSLATQNYHLIALRQFLKYLAKRDVSALAPEKVGLAKLPEREIDVLYPEEVDALLSAPQVVLRSSEELVPQQKKSLLRDTALLHILFSTGMRVSEAVRLNRDDIRADRGEVPVRGKGNKVRVVFLSPEAVAYVEAYLEARTDTDPALFVRHKKGIVSEDESLRITPRTVQRQIKKYAAVAGLTKQVTPHTLRHSFATDLLANGADVRHVQQLLGHSSITTTQIYTHLTDAHLQDVHSQFHRKARD